MRETLDYGPLFRTADPQSSRDAAARVAPHLSKLQEEVLSAIREHPGITAKQLEQMDRFASYGFSTTRKRASELKRLGKVRVIGTNEDGEQLQAIP